MTRRHAVLLLFLVFSFLGCTMTPDEGSRGKLEIPPTPVVVTSECGNFLVRFTFERKSQTVATYSVYITDLSGQPFAHATRVILAFTPLNQEDENTVTLVAHPSAQGIGIYIPSGTYTPRPGLWKIEAVIRQVQSPDALCIFRTNL